MPMLGPPQSMCPVPARHGTAPGERGHTTWDTVNPQPCTVARDLPSGLKPSLDHTRGIWGMSKGRDPFPVSSAYRSVASFVLGLFVSQAFVLDTVLTLRNAHSSGIRAPQTHFLHPWLSGASPALHKVIANRISLVVSGEPPCAEIQQEMSQLWLFLGDFLHCD